MAEREERTIGQLPALEELNDESLLPTEQSGIAYKMSGAQIKAFARESASAEANRATAAADRADQTAAQVEQAVANPPYIGTNGNWYIYSTASSQFVDSGYSAYGQAPTISSTPISGGNAVTFTGGNSETINVMDGDSPTVTVTNISGGHRVTIVDAAHPSGQTFDVMDGAGSGDMKASVYDADSAVANAGGIADYVSDEISGITKSTVGLGNVDNVRQYSASNPPPYPVTTVQSRTGAVTIMTQTTVTLTAAGWIGSAAPYSQQVTVSGVSTTKAVIVDLNITSGSTDATALTNWANICKYGMTLATNAITFYTATKPSAAVSVKVAIIG